MTRIIITLLFFLSGASGLILETVWFRQLAGIFGSSSMATATVTAAFLGGLGLGGFAASWWVDRLSRRVVAYGALEVFVGLYALASPFVLDGLNRMQAELFGGAYLTATAYGSLRFVVVFLALLPPTFAMGATLPLLTRALTASEPGIGRSLGALYGLNTLGAFAGVLAAGFVLLPALGQQSATHVAAALSLGVGVLALLIGAFFMSTSEAEKRRESERKSGKTPLRAMRPYALLLLFMLLSGFSAMLVQVAYTRTLAVVLGSSTYSFTLIVGVFLGGIGLGSLLYGAVLAKRVEPFQLLAFSQLVLGVFLILSVQVVDRFPTVLMHFANRSAISPGAVFMLHAGLTALVLLVPTLCMGVSFPAAVRLLSLEVRRLGHDVGRAYFVNTLGSIAGSFMAAFVLIPAMGLQSTIAYAAGLSLVFAALFYANRDGFLIRKRLMIAAPLAVLASLLLLYMPQWDVGRLTSGMFRVGLAKKMGERKEPPRSSMLYYRDGPMASVSVERREGIATMRINGKVEASDRFDMPTQVLVGLLPILLHDQPANQKAALIGWGSGVTAGAMLSAPIASLTACEIEPRVIEASRFFNHINQQPLKDARLDLHIGDARSILGYGRERFDVIVSEPSNPWVTGASALFTVDFYRLMAERLREGGVFGQWVQLYELSPEHLRALVRTFNEVFPHVLIFSTAERGVDLVMLGRFTPWTLNIEPLIERVRLPGVTRSLGLANVGGAYDMLALLAVAGEKVDEFAGEGPLVTDDNGLIEFSAPKDMLFYDQYAKHALDFHFNTAYGDVLELLADLGDTPDERAGNMAALSLRLLTHGRVDAAYKLASASLKVTVNDLAIEVMEVCELIYLKPENWPPLANTWLIADKEDPRYTELFMAMGEGAHETVIELADALAKADDDKRLSLIAGVAALKRLDFPAAWQRLEPLSEDEAFRTRHPEVDFFAGRTADRLLKFRQAVRLVARFNAWRKAAEQPIGHEAGEGETIEIPLEILEGE